MTAVAVDSAAATAEAPAPATPAAPEAKRSLDPQSPWPGLAAFDEESAAFFHGRAEEAAELHRLVMQAPLTVLFGKSGLGKSSLLKAGLFPLLRDGCLPVYVRLAIQEQGTRLIDQLDAALLAEAKARGVEVEPSDTHLGLWERLHRRDFALWRARTELVTPLFVIDQFEEIFTLGTENPDAIAQLRIELADLIENRIPAALVEVQEREGEALALLDVKRQRYKVLLSLREDFLVELEGWRRHIPSVMHNRFRLKPMTAAQAFDAVYKTGQRAKLVDEDTAKAIVRFVGKIQEEERSVKPAAKAGATAEDSDALPTHEIEPALLSLVCAELNKRRMSARQATINADLLKGTGASIIADFYFRQVASIPAAGRKFIEEDLLTEGGYRSSFPVTEALRDGKLTQDVLTRLIDGRVLRIEHQLGTQRVELTHDRLTDVVRAERDKRRERERSASRRRWMWVFGFVAAVIAVMGFWAASNQIATIRAQSERDEAQRQRVIAEQALADLKREQAAAESARKAAEEERERASNEAKRADQQTQRAKWQNDVLSEVYAPLRAAVLRLRMRGFPVATAFVVSRSGLAVTPAHAVANAAKHSLEALNFNGTRYDADLLKVDETRDLALLRLRNVDNMPCLQLATEPVKPSTAVVSLSISEKDWSAKAGTVSRTDVPTGPIGLPKLARLDDLIEVGMQTEGGFSGAPVIDTSRRVIGMGAYGPVGKPQALLIPASRIRTAFREELGSDPCNYASTR